MSERLAGSRSKVVCDALLLDEESRSDTYPTIRIGEDDVDIGHEATVSKSISKNGGRASYRGLLKVADGAYGSKSNVVCDALLLDPESHSDTFPTIRIDESDANVGHEASVSKIGEEQLFYLQTHGLDEEEASKMIVNGFIEPVVKELPMEYAVEMNRLIELQMEGSIG